MIVLVVMLVVVVMMVDHQHDWDCSHGQKRGGVSLRETELLWQALGDEK